MFYPSFCTYNSSLRVGARVRNVVENYTGTVVACMSAKVRVLQVRFGAGVSLAFVGAALHFLQLLAWLRVLPGPLLAPSFTGCGLQ